MGDKIANYADIKRRAQQRSQQERTQIELAESDPLAYYSRLLDFQYVLGVQSDIAEVINASKLVEKYDPLTIAVGMIGLLEDTFGAMIADAIYSNLMNMNPDTKPEELAGMADEQNKVISGRILDIRSYIADCINTRQSEQEKQMRDDIEAGRETSVIVDRPADDVMAITSILRQGVDIMVSSTRAFVERNQGAAIDNNNSQT